MDKDDRLWNDVKRRIFSRDKEKCRLTDLLTIEEFHKAKGSKGLIAGQVLDAAHVIRRSQSPKLKYCLRNVVLLRRSFHDRLDQYKDPVTGESISKEEADNWWLRIVGRETWDWLQENK